MNPRGNPAPGAPAKGKIAPIHALRNTMSAPAHHDAPAEKDPVEAIVKHIPLVLPLVGAVLMFLLAFIAVFMA